MTIGGYLLPGIIAEFHRLHPGVEIQLEIANTRDIQKLLADGLIEIGFTEGPDTSENLESEIFFQDELVAIAPPGHPLLAKKGVSIREVCREPLILREEGSGTRAAVEKALGRKRIKVKPLLSLSSPEAIKNAVAAGMGLAIVSRLIVGLETQGQSLGIIQLKDFSIPRPLHLQRLPGKSQTPSAGKFLSLLANKLRSSPGSHLGLQPRMDGGSGRD
jgi:DNA-binding transcriptional LysR family regulator